MSQGALFPTAGEWIERGGIRWTVVDLEPEHVRFQVEGFEEEPPRRVSRAHWERVARKARTVGDCQGRRVASGMSCARQGSDPLTRAASGRKRRPAHERR